MPPAVFSIAQDQACRGLRKTHRRGAPGIGRELERWHREAVVNAIERIRVSKPSEAAQLAIQAGNELARARPPHAPAVYLAVRALFAVAIYHVAVRGDKAQNPLGLLVIEIQAIYERSHSGSAWRRTIAPLLAPKDPLALKLGVLQVLPENMNWRQPALEALELLEAVGAIALDNTNSRSDRGN